MKHRAFTIPSNDQRPPDSSLGSSVVPHSIQQTYREKIREALFLALEETLARMNPGLHSPTYTGRPGDRKVGKTPEGRVLGAVETAIQTLATQLELAGPTRIRAVLGLDTPMSVEALEEAYRTIEARLRVAGFAVRDENNG